VGRAIERSDRRLREATPRLRTAGEQHQLGLAILLADFRQDPIPRILGFGHHPPDELVHLFFLRTRKGPATGGLLLLDVAATTGVEIAGQQGKWVDPEQPGDAEQDEDAEDADAAAAAHASAAYPATEAT